MKYIPADTTIEAARVQFAALRRIGIEGRGRMLAELCENMRRNTESGIRWAYPHYTEDQVRREVIRRTLGPELFKKIFTDRGL